jgi:hypothetical protein
MSKDANIIESKTEKLKVAHNLPRMGVKPLDLSMGI